MRATRKAYTQPEIDRIRRLTETHGPVAAARIVGSCPATIASMRKRGWRVAKLGPPIRPVPSDFAIQAAHLTIRELVEHYGSSIVTVSRWAVETDRQNMRGHRFEAIPVPTDLADRLRRAGTTATARELGVDRKTVLRWRRRLQLDNAGHSTAKRVWGPRS